jgi:hypothetical protein
LDLLVLLVQLILHHHYHVRLCRSRWEKRLMLEWLLLLEQQRLVRLLLERLLLGRRLLLGNDLAVLSRCGKTPNDLAGLERLMPKILVMGSG